jgi:murein DD-endopeptidase MepM/ murein hydrolase activator NlpD
MVNDLPQNTKHLIGMLLGAVALGIGVMGKVGYVPPEFSHERKSKDTDSDSILEFLLGELPVDSQVNEKLVVNSELQQVKLPGQGVVWRYGLASPLEDCAQHCFTDYFGTPRKRGRRHAGIDLDGGIGDPVLSMCGGVVDTVQYRNRGRSGKYVSVRCKDTAEDLRVAYVHLDKVHVRRGQKVSRGQRLGDVGNTGVVQNGSAGDGSHLHLAVKVRKGRGYKPVNPLYTVKGASPDFSRRKK